MNVQPLVARHLSDAQHAAVVLFPWEREHQLALAAAADPIGHASFLSRNRLDSVRCWTVGTAGYDVSGIAALYGYRAQPDELWLAWFGLLPHARGDGRGGKMLDWLIALARTEGRRTLRLWTTDEPEYACAKALYFRRGFVAEDHPALPGEDWKTFVFSLSLDGQPSTPWAAVRDRGELCGRESPLVAAAA
jgi:GNAT superfamily N-acetyltransferase